MKNKDYYPAGLSEDSPDTPWNPDKRLPLKEFEITVSQTLSKTITVETDDYRIQVTKEPENGIYERITDTSDTAWDEVFYAEHHTPDQLMKIFARYLEDILMKKDTMPKSPSFLMKLIGECQDWIEDETEFVRE